MTQPETRQPPAEGPDPGDVAAAGCGCCGCLAVLVALAVAAPLIFKLWQWAFR